MDWREILPKLQDMERNKKEIATDRIEVDSSQSNAIHPPMYKIWIINDQKLPAAIYAKLLDECFNYNSQKILGTINHLQYDGQVGLGLYTLEIAENKMINVIDFAASTGHQVKCIMCKESGYALKKS